MEGPEGVDVSGGIGLGMEENEHIQDLHALALDKRAFDQGREVLGRGGAVLGIKSIPFNCMAMAFGME